MKLTLSIGGGITGLTKVHSVDTNTLDKNTVAALMDYINSSEQKMTLNFNETWSLDDEKEVPIDKNKMNDQLKHLYERMKKDLSYTRP